MTTKDLIDRILNYTDNVASSDADNATNRLRILEWTQEVFDNVWNRREWNWKLKTSTITVTAGNTSANLPADFQEIGAQGGVYNSQGFPVEPVHPQEIQYRITRGQALGSQRIYSIFIDDDAGVQKFQVPVSASSDTYTLYYEAAPPILIDKAESGHNLVAIPAMWHFQVLLSGVKEKAARSLGDARAESEWRGQFEQGLVHMIRRERNTRRSTTRRMPRAVPGMW